VACVRSATATSDSVQLDRSITLTASVRLCRDRRQREAGTGAKMTARVGAVSTGDAHTTCSTSSRTHRTTTVHIGFKVVLDAVAAGLGDTAAAATIATGLVSIVALLSRIYVTIATEKAAGLSQAHRLHCAERRTRCARSQARCDLTAARLGRTLSTGESRTRSTGTSTLSTAQRTAWIQKTFRVATGSATSTSPTCRLAPLLNTACLLNTGVRVAHAVVRSTYATCSRAGT